jgi:endonuclease I
VRRLRCRVHYLAAASAMRSNLIIAARHQYPVEAREQRTNAIFAVQGWVKRV